MGLTLLAIVSSSCVYLSSPLTDRPRQAARHRLFKFQGHQVHYEETGQGPTVILAHGFGGSMFSWRHLMPELGKTHRVAALDLLGFGLTERPEDRSSYSRTNQVELLSAFVRHLDVESAHFGGHSYGGGMVMSLAHTQPELVRSMVLIDTTAPEYSDKRRHFFARPPLSTLFVRTMLRPWLIRRSLRRSFFDDSAVTDKLVKQYLSRLRIEGAARAYAGLTAPTDPDPRFADLELEKLDQPTLVIWGAEDTLISVGDGREAADRLPNSRFVEIPECGHIPMEEKPQEVLAVMTQFLTELDGSS